MEQKKTYQSVLLFDLELFGSTSGSLLIKIDELLQKPITPICIATPNPEQVMLSRKDHIFLHLLQSFDVLIPDGMGLVWASKLLALRTHLSPLAERITGVWLTEQLLVRATSSNERVLILGGREYAGASVQIAGKSFVVGTDALDWISGYESVSTPTPDEEAIVVAKIATTRPTYLFVAFGAPYQEKWVQEHRQLLHDSGVRIVVTVGGAFDMLLGRTPRAPGFVQALQLEWLYRLLQEPWRFRRQSQLLRFCALVVREFFSPR